MTETVIWIEDFSEILPHIINAPSWTIITDSTVYAYYVSTWLDTLAHSYPNKKQCVVIVEPGELSKNRTTKERIEDQLCEAGIQDTWVIGIGGGVITDLAGFFASTWRRGVPLVLVPTTTMAMLDASIGGKNGVNVGVIKNAIGTIYEARCLIYCPKVLASLSDHQYGEGWIEYIKHIGLSGEKPVLMGSLRQRDTLAIRSALEQSLAFKQKVVASDQQDRSRRRILNWGHTIGHALEAYWSYRIPHGFCVAYGLWMESIYAEHYHGVSKALRHELTEWLRVWVSHYVWPEIHVESLMASLVWDKKCSDSMMIYPVVRSWGSVELMQCNIMEYQTRYRSLGQAWLQFQIDTKT